MGEPTNQPCVPAEWPVEKYGVMIAGENPMIVLYRPESDECVAIASVWTSAYSEAGEGRVLVIWVDPEATGLGEFAPVGLFTDNPDLAQFVWKHFYKDYAPIQGRGIEESPLRTARFTVFSDSPSLYRISCTSGSTAIELEWREALDPFHTVVYPTGFEASLVAVPCASGTISVNGTQAAGEIHQPEGWFKSSAFLAFAETWVALPDEAGGGR